MHETVDIAIVGAGLSGLQAALDVHRAGRSFVILEARDRVGGKTLTVQRPDGKGNQELGPAWINDTNQSRIWAYVKRFGLTPVTQNIQGTVACEDEDGSWHSFPYGSLPEVSLRPSRVSHSVAPLQPLEQSLSDQRGSLGRPRRRTSS